MLNKIIERLNGSAESAGAITEALADVRNERQAIELRLVELSDQRRRALLDDVDDAGVAKIERLQERERLRIEKADITIPALEARLQDARARERKAAEPGFVKEHGAAFAAYCEALRAAAEAHRRQEEIRARAAKLLGTHRAAVLVPAFAYGGMLTAANLDEWFARNARELEFASGTREHQSTHRPTQSAPKPERLPGSMQHPVSLAVGMGAVPRAPRAVDDTAPLEPGQVRVKVMRAGFSPADDRPQATYGQLLRMPAETAVRAAGRGAVEIVETRMSAAPGAAPVEAGAP